MVRSGAFGGFIRGGAFALVAVFVGCGGSSKTNHDGDDGGGNGGASGAGRGGTGVGADGGTSAGTSAGGAARGGAGAQGGTGATGPIEPPGPVFCGGEPCDAPLACCIATGACYDPLSQVNYCSPPDPDGDPEGRATCASNAHCAEGEFCMLEGQSCLGTGHCQPIDNCGTCGGGGGGNDPVPECRVCACDGNTYTNVQTACRAGANAPLSSGAGCGETATEGGGGSSTTGPHEFIPCGNDQNCPSGSFCCSMVARCYPESDRDICVPPPPGARIACKTNANCSDYEYCLGDGCDAPGGCVNRGSQGGDDCGVTLEAVCGCDGTSYTNAGCASMRGVRVDYAGECVAN